MFFLLPLVCTAYFIDLFISINLKKSNSYAQGEYTTWNDIYNGKINSDLIINGSSRAWVEIDPTMIGDSLHTTAYNIGIDGYSFPMQYLRHSLLMEYNPRPKLIIHSVDFFTFFVREDLYNYEQFLPYMLFNKEMRCATIGYKGFNLIDYELPLVRYYGKLDVMQTALGLFLNPQDNELKRVKGYEPQNMLWGTDFEQVKKEMNTYSVKIDSATVLLFERYLQECKTNGIKIILVYTPEYIEGQKFVKNRDEVIQIFTTFSRKYDVPFYDFSKDSMSFQTKYFFNSMHLNKTGAELFTNKLIKKIKEIQ